MTVSYSFWRVIEMVEHIVLPIAADEYLMRFDEESIESMLPGNFGMLSVHVELKEFLKGRNMQRFHFGRRRGVRLANFEVIAPEIFGFFIMGQNFKGFGAKNVRVEQLTAIVVID